MNILEGKLVSIVSSLHGEQIGPATAYKTSKFEQWLSDWVSG
jgi:hypothetical protein